MLGCLPTANSTTRSAFRIWPAKLADARTGKNGRHALVGMLRQAVFAANAVRLQLHALAYNLGNFLRTLATPEPIKDWSLTSL